MNILKEYDENCLTVIVEGEIDTFNSKELEMEVNSEIGFCDAMVFDFKELSYISSAGLRVLISVKKKLETHRASFKIINVSETIRDIFTVSGLDQFLNIE